MITQDTAYKGRPAIRIATETLDALILPGDGGKMASLKCARTGFEFLCQSPGDAYLHLDAEGSYVDSECSGFDDMFPTIDPYTPAQGKFRGIAYPDHGEICRLGHSVRLSGGSVEFAAESAIFPITWSKRIGVSPGGGLTLHYTVKNRGDEELPCLWAAHCMLAGTEGARVLAGFEPDDEVEVLFSSNPALYAPGSRRAWAGTPAADRLEPFRPDGTTWKYFFTSPFRQGFCGCEYPGVGRLLFQFDREKVPWLEVWLNSGGFQGKYNIALEPCTAPYDSPGEAARRGYSAVVPAGGSLELGLTISLEI